MVIREKHFAVDDRLNQLTISGQATSYAKQKNSLQSELGRFLTSLPGVPTIATVTPRDLCRFLVYNDRNGKTQIHLPGWCHLGKQGTHNCGCPIRLSYKTIDSYIGKLRALLHAQGREGEWDRCLSLGNIAS